MTEAAASPSEVTLVDEQGRPIGVEEKLRAHQDGGRLHLAFSIFLFDAGGRTLLQRRAVTKYHFGGLWTNACCSHPPSDAGLLQFARARLVAELGVDAELAEAFTLIYRATDDVSGLTEHELDHVLIGRFDGDPRPDPAEVDDWRWAELGDIAAELAIRPDLYTPWFRLLFERVVAHQGAVP